MCVCAAEFSQPCFSKLFSRYTHFGCFHNNAAWDNGPCVSEPHCTQPIQKHLHSSTSCGMFGAHAVYVCKGHRSQTKTATTQHKFSTAIFSVRPRVPNRITLSHPVLTDLGGRPVTATPATKTVSRCQGVRGRPAVAIVRPVALVRDGGNHRVLPPTATRDAVTGRGAQHNANRAQGTQCTCAV